MRLGVLSALLIVGTNSVSAQFVDDFEGQTLQGWTFRTGDGGAEMKMIPGPGNASILVDATNDEYNIWWALIKRDVSDWLDLERLSRTGSELRVEARVRPSSAPKRINLHLNTQRTVDFHTHLMEYDLPDTVGWHLISMTTRGFDARPGDTINAQLALMDWGRGKYRLDIDYLRVDVVDADRVGPDLGEPLPYRPPVPPVSAFAYHVAAIQGAMVDLDHPDVNLAGWRFEADSRSTPVLTVDGSHYVILRWDLSEFAGMEAAGPGLLELPSHAVQRAPSDIEELGQVRVVEIFDGDPNWRAETVTLNSWTRGRALSEVVNTQMIIDVDLTDTGDGSAFATINRPVMQRLLDGRTPGLMLRPLGPVSASIRGPGEAGPRLHFNVRRGGARSNP